MNRAQYVNLYQRLERTRTRYTECVKITRNDGTVFRFTAHDKDLPIWEGSVRHIYKPAGAFQLTALENSAGLAVSNMDIEALITDDAITENDLRAGLFDNANIELFIAYWANTQVGTLPLRTSWIGELQVAQNSFKADLRGIAQKLAQAFIQAASLECRYSFCDVNMQRSYCGQNRATHTERQTVTEVLSRTAFKTDNAQPGTIYKWGLASFVTGGNAGVEMEIVQNHGTKFGLFLPPPYVVQVGDEIDMLRGCDKTYQACKGFGNLDNFGGEPFLTGSDLIRSWKPLDIDGDTGGGKKK